MAPSIPTTTSDLPNKEVVEEKAVQATSALTSYVRSFASGGVGGVCAVIVGHPFDLVKVRLQTAEKGVYNGAIDCVRQTVAREGLRRVHLTSTALFSLHRLTQL